MKLSRIIALFITIVNIQSVYPAAKLSRPASNSSTASQPPSKIQLDALLQEIINTQPKKGTSIWSASSVGNKYILNQQWISAVITAAQGTLSQGAFPNTQQCINYILTGIQQASTKWPNASFDDAVQKISATLQPTGQPITGQLQSQPRVVISPTTGQPITNSYQPFTLPLPPLPETTPVQLSKPTENAEEQQDFFIALDNLEWDVDAPSIDWQNDIAKIVTHLIINNVITESDALKKINSVIDAFIKEREGRWMYAGFKTNIKAIAQTIENIETTIKKLIKEDIDRKNLISKNPQETDAVKAIFAKVEEEDSLWGAGLFGAIPPYTWNSEVASVIVDFIAAGTISFADALGVINKLIDEKAKHKGAWSFWANESLPLDNALIQEAKSNIKAAIERKAKTKGIDLVVISTPKETRSLTELKDIEKERLEKAKEKIEQERLENNKLLAILEEKKLENEKLEQEKRQIEKEQLERQTELKRLENARLEKEKQLNEAKETQAKKKLEEEKAELQKEEEKLVKKQAEENERLAQLKKEKSEKENLEKERIENLRLEREKTEREESRKLESERLEKEQSKERLNEIEKEEGLSGLKKEFESVTKKLNELNPSETEKKNELLELYGILEEKIYAMEEQERLKEERRKEAIREALMYQNFGEV